jgi:hypothetical protein
MGPGRLNVRFSPASDASPRSSELRVAAIPDIHGRLTTPAPRTHGKCVQHQGFWDRGIDPLGGLEIDDGTRFAVHAVKNLTK